MAIPTSIATGLISGIVGALSHWGPMRARTAVINSETEANNVFGRAFTFEDQTVETVQAGGDGVFAGILVHPEAHKITADGVPNGYVGEFLDMGEIYVQVEGAADAAIGDPVYFVPETGALTATDGSDPGAEPPVAATNTEVPNARIERHLPSAETPNLVVIRLTN